MHAGPIRRNSFAEGRAEGYTRFKGPVAEGHAEGHTRSYVPWGLGGPRLAQFSVAWDLGVPCCSGFGGAFCCSLGPKGPRLAQFEVAWDLGGVPGLFVPLSAAHVAVLRDALEGRAPQRRVSLSQGFLYRVCQAPRTAQESIGSGLGRPTQKGV